MARFPMFFNVEDRKCVVFGGGKVALRNVRTLVEFGARVVAVDKHCCQELLDMEAQGLIETDKGFFGRPLFQRFNDVCATDDEDFNREMVETCKRKKIPVNSATDGPNSDSLFPAVTKRGEYCCGNIHIRRSPCAVAQIRSMVDELLPMWYEKISEVLKRSGKRSFPKRMMRQNAVRSCMRLLK